MDNNQKKAFKLALRQFAEDLISTRIQAARLQADQAQEAANQEEKSSAGDKYETARAAGHLLKEMHSRQQAEHARDLAALHQVKVDTLYSSPTAGAFIQCPGISFFIAAGLGKQQFQGQTILFLSPAAPLAKTLFNKKAGEPLVFNNHTLLIEDIF
jgi:hypothetical protein